MRRSILSACQLVNRAVAGFLIRTSVSTGVSYMLPVFGGTGCAFQRNLCNHIARLGAYNVCHLFFAAWLSGVAVRVGVGYRYAFLAVQPLSLAHTNARRWSNPAALERRVTVSNIVAYLARVSTGMMPAHHLPTHSAGDSIVARSTRSSYARCVELAPGADRRPALGRA